MSKPDLYEQYEDALFALLMEEVAETEGEALIDTCHELGRPNASDDASDFSAGRDTITGEFNRQAFAKAKKCTASAMKTVSYITSFALMITAAFYGMSPNFRTGVQTLFSPTTDFFEAADYLGMTASDFGIVKPDSYTVENHDVQETEAGESVETVTYADSKSGQDVTVKVYSGTGASAEEVPPVPEIDPTSSQMVYEQAYINDTSLNKFSSTPYNYNSPQGYESTNSPEVAIVWDLSSDMSLVPQVHG